MKISAVIAAGCLTFAVGAWIGGAYFFTSSTSFANPAVTVARTLSDTFAGIATASVPPFLVAEVVGGALGAVLVGWLFHRSNDAAVPHAQGATDG